MLTHHKASLRPYAVGDSLDPSIRKEDGVLASDLEDVIIIRRHRTVSSRLQTRMISPEPRHSAPAG